MKLAAKNISVKGRLRNVSAEFASAQITAICGPNGAGKSTLLAVLAGLLPLDEGRVDLGEQALLDLSPRERARQIGYLPQNGEIAWDVSVRNLVALGRLPFGDAHSDPIDAAIAALELNGLAARPISTLSGGEKARALLARVLAGEPRWLLADEPLAALDIAHQMHLVRHLRQVAATGVGVVIVLHDLALAMNHANRVLVLDDGEVAAFGAPHEVLTAHLIERVWHAPVDWIGEAGRRALVAG